MMQYSRIILALLIFLMSSQVIAEPADFLCTIERVPLAETLAKSERDFVENLYVGKKFTVDRSSGLMDGVLKNSYTAAAVPQVIDQGNQSNAYKVVTTINLSTGSNLYVLMIRNYEKTPNKSFMFINNEDIYLGTCQHFYN